MTQRLSMLANVLAAAARRAWMAAMDCCRSMMCERTQVYHPEAYYMRGPGPRWREKHFQGRDI
jgi:hypothetical protein